MINFQWQKRWNKGFTLVELLLSIGILLILFTFVNQGFIKNQRGMEFEIAADDLYSRLYEARESSRHYKDSDVYGVSLESERYYFFKGNTLSTGEILATWELNSFIVLDNITLEGGGNEIVFGKNTGKTTQFGSFEMVSDDGEKILFEINSQGYVSRERVEN